jgi:predicted amidohydrolase
MYRLDALEGADLFLIPAEWPAERITTMRLLARARAAENQAYAVLCNRAGPAEDGTVFGGGSMVVGPDGTVLADAGAAEETIRAALDPAAVAAVRARLPVFDQRAAGVDWRC